MHAPRGSRGFTLIEIIIVLVLTAILSSATVPLLLMLMDAIRYDQRRNNLVETSRLAADRMALEIRSIMNTDSISIASSKNIQFASNMLDANSCNDGSTPTARVVRVAGLTAGQLDLSVQRTCGGAAQVVTMPLSKYLAEITFTYFDAEGVVLASPTVGPDTEIVSIRVETRFRDSTLSGRLESPFRTITEYHPKNLGGVTEAAILP